MPLSVNQSGQQVETAADWIRLQLAWPEAALPRCAGVMAVFRLCGGLPRDVAILGDRRPVLSCIAHLCERIRVGRQTGGLSLCRIQK